MNKMPSGIKFIDAEMKEMDADAEEMNADMKEIDTKHTAECVCMKETHIDHTIYQYLHGIIRIYI